MRGTWLIAFVTGLASYSQLWAAPPASQPTSAPADATLDWLLQQSTTAPSLPAGDTSATQPASPLASKTKGDGYREGTIMLNGGNEKIRGRIGTTRGKPVRVWNDEDKEYRDIPFALVRSLEAKILWERDEKEWHFKESGSDIKEYTGKTYPAREMQYTVTLLNGQTVTGGIVLPLYFETPEGDKTFVLHKRDKGEVGQTLKQLIYVRRVDFAE